MWTLDWLVCVRRVSSRCVVCYPWELASGGKGGFSPGRWGPIYQNSENTVSTTGISRACPSEHLGDALDKKVLSPIFRTIAYGALVAAC